MVPVRQLADREVGEHSSRRRRFVEKRTGASGKEDVGISNDKAGEKPVHRKTKVS